jgi:uncharacterized membrane protein YhaH (DUF805 family)
VTYDTLFVNPAGRTSRMAFVAALIPLLAVAALYAFVVTGRTAQFCLVVLILPALVLHARRLHDMGQTGWLVLAPGALLLATAWLYLYDAGPRLETPVGVAAGIVSAGFVLWGVVGKGRAAA